MASVDHCKVFGILILVAWISSVYFLFPLPSHALVELDDKTTTELIEQTMKQTGMAKPEVERLIRMQNEREQQIAWVRWVFVLLLIAAGVASGLTALYSTTNWTYYATSTSFFYVVGWLILLTGQHVPSHATILDTYVSNFLNGLLVDSVLPTLAFLHKDFLLPLFHFFIATFLIHAKTIKQV